MGVSNRSRSSFEDMFVALFLTGAMILSATLLWLAVHDPIGVGWQGARAVLTLIIVASWCREIGGFVERSMGVHCLSSDLDNKSRANINSMVDDCLVIDCMGDDWIDLVVTDESAE